MRALVILNGIIGAIFAICYFYQLVYTFIPWIKKKKEISEARTMRSFAVMICARNEKNVIGNLINSIKQQAYPQDRITTFVMADNCTDETAVISEGLGARVYIRNNKELIGKGYALDELLNHMKVDYPEGFDAYLIIDADNLLKEDFIANMNLMLEQGYDISTCYRNSKNYGDNWISAGYALWFLRESRYLNHSRYLLNSSCAVSGTGFMFSRKIAEELDGWPYHLLTEDVQFSVDQIIKGRKIAFCKDAELYDEQPTDFCVSWKQRMRWTKGNLQVFTNYGKELIKGFFKGNFACYDMLMAAMPAFFLSAIAVICNTILIIYYLFAGESIVDIIYLIGIAFANAYVTFALTGAVAAITEWKYIKASTFQKILSIFTFPLYMATYIPITVSALFAKPAWEPIVHKVSISNISEIGKERI